MCKEISPIKIISATYSHDFLIALTFSDGETLLFDFLPLFQKHVKGDNLKYFAPQNFKKLILKNGNIYWGRNEDVIFPVSLLRAKSNSKIAEEKTLYII